MVDGSKWAYTEVVNKVSELNKTFYLFFQVARLFNHAESRS